MIDSYILNALYAGICVSIIGGGLGCFVIWKKMAYFGDSLSHSSLLGIALGIALGINTTIGTFVICSIFTFLLIYLQNKRILSNDTLLGILAHSSLSIGIVSISLLKEKTKKVPTLSVILIGNYAPSEIYVKNKLKKHRHNDEKQSKNKHVKDIKLKQITIYIYI